MLAKLDLHKAAEKEAECEGTSRMCIEEVFTFITSPATPEEVSARFELIQDLTEDKSRLETCPSTYTLLEGYLNWDTYHFPDLKLPPAAHYWLSFNSFCNADLRDIAGRTAMDAFTFQAFNGVSEEPFHAGLVFLHVDKVCTTTSFIA
jgi:hypothetical protein